MKFLIGLIALTVVECYTVEKVPGIDGVVRRVEINQLSETFLTAHKVDNYTSYKFYKLNSTNNVVIEKEFPGWVYILMNSLGDVYIFHNTDGVEKLWFLQSGTDLMELISEYLYHAAGCVDVLNFIDNDDILYVNHGSGVSFLKPRENILFAVDNLEGYNFCGGVVDGQGNVYLRLNQNRPIAVIRRESKSSSILQAEFLEGFNDGIDRFIVNGYGDNVLVGVTGRSASMGYNMKLQLQSFNSAEVLLYKYNTSIANVYTTKTHTVVPCRPPLPIGQGQEYSGDQYHAYVLSPNNPIKVIKTQILNDGNDVMPVTNSIGHIFHGYSKWNGEESYYDSFLVVMKPDEVKVEQIPIPSQYRIGSLLVDFDDNLWVVAKGLYYVPKGTDNLIQVSDLPLTALGEDAYHSRQNPVNKDLYFGTEDGLYVCKK